MRWRVEHPKHAVDNPTTAVRFARCGVILLIDRYPTDEDWIFQMDSAVTSGNTKKNIGIIGAGRVGAVLGAALVQAGHRVIAAVGVSAASKARAEQLLPGVQLLPADRVAASADLILLAVPDDILAGLVNGLVETGALRPGQIVAHTSGAHGLAVLNPVTTIGVHPLALHPAMTFTGTEVDLERLAAGVSFGVTAPEHLRGTAD